MALVKNDLFFISTCWYEIARHCYKNQRGYYYKNCKQLRTNRSSRRDIRPTKRRHANGRPTNRIPHRIQRDWPQACLHTGMYDLRSGHSLCTQAPTHRLPSGEVWTGLECCWSLEILTQGSIAAPAQDQTPVRQWPPPRHMWCPPVLACLMRSCLYLHSSVIITAGQIWYERLKTSRNHTVHHLAANTPAKTSLGILCYEKE
jgi:hypothetical protein